VPLKLSEITCPVCGLLMAQFLIDNDMATHPTCVYVKRKRAA